MYYNVLRWCTDNLIRLNTEKSALLYQLLQIFAHPYVILYIIFEPTYDIGTI